MTEGVHDVVSRLLETDHLEDADLFPNQEIGYAAFRINSGNRVLPSFITNSGYTGFNFRDCRVLPIETGLAPGTDSYFRMYPLYGDPKVHDWSALSPYLEPDTIPQELEPIRAYVEREYARRQARGT